MKFTRNFKQKYVNIFLIVFVIGLFLATFIGLKQYQKALPLQAHAATPRSCTPSTLPIGAIAGQPAPMWCYNDLATGVTTIKSGENSMIDEFNHGLQFADCCSGYSVFNNLRNVGKTVYWRHNDHWMVDSDGASSMMRPNQTFAFENGKLIVEADVAASVKGYNEKIWPELDITTASSPTSPRTNALYGYDQFSGHLTLGCKLQGVDRQVVCSLMDKSDKGVTDGARTTYEGNLLGQNNTAWRVCNAGDPDQNCRDRFRLELTRDSITMYVNGIRYMQRSLLSPLPEEFMKSNLYVYFSSWNLNSTGVPYRYHWDRLAVNPKDVKGTLLPPSAAPDFGAAAPTLTSSILASTIHTAAPEGSIQFSGKGFGRIPHANYYNGLKGWTIETWFKDESKEGKGYYHPNRYILAKGDTKTSEDMPYILGIGFNKLFVGTRIDGQNKTIYYDLAENNVSFNQWHHVAATFNTESKELVLYLDGLAILKSIVPGYTGKNIQPLYIGRNGSSNYWIGKLDDVRIWDKARTDIEIRNNYQTQLEAPDSHLIGNWKFDDDKGTFAKDFSSKREIMSIYEGTWSADVHFSHE